jgi:hypothetical protein
MKLSQGPVAGACGVLAAVVKGVLSALVRGTTFWSVCNGGLRIGVSLPKYGCHSLLDRRTSMLMTHARSLARSNEKASQYSLFHGRP